MEYGLIGRPLAHSFSPKFFAHFFQQEGIDASYTAYELERVDELIDLLAHRPRLVGLNVTSPYKEDVLRYCHNLSTEVETLRAANVLYIDRANNNVTITAYNSDVLGFQLSLEPLLIGRPVRRAIILGSGGAARAVAYALSALGIEHLYVSRSHIGQNYINYTEANELLPSLDLVINASPVGYDLNTAPQIDYSRIGSRHICYDLIYNPSETRFLHLAKQQGAITKNGQEMLERQALEAWRIWQSHQPHSR